MLRRERIPAVFVATAFAWGAIWAGCVGDAPEPGLTPDPNAPPGSYRGACMAEDKCLDGLACTQGICLYPDGGGPTDGAASDGGPPGDAADPADASDGAPACTEGLGPDNGHTCGAALCPAGKTCCAAGDAGFVCRGEAGCHPSAGEKDFQCIGRTGATGCAGATTRCCLSVTDVKALMDGKKCPATIEDAVFDGTRCGTAGCAGANELKVCQTDQDCSNHGTCHAVRLATSGQHFAFGVCY